MEEWKIEKIKKAISELKKEEARKFAIAYGELPEKYHGYLQSLPQNVQIWWEAAPDETLKELQKEYGWAKISQFETQKGNGKFRMYYKVEAPYLGIDGHLAMFTDQHKDGSIRTEIQQVGERLLVKARVFTENGSFEGVSEIPPKDKVDKHIANAIRKALTYTGDGRFPIHKTEYGGHPMIVKFREFMQKEKENG